MFKYLALVAGVQVLLAHQNNAHALREYVTAWCVSTKTLGTNYSVIDPITRKEQSCELMEEVWRIEWVGSDSPMAKMHALRARMKNDDGIHRHDIVRFRDIQNAPLLDGNEWRQRATMDVITRRISAVDYALGSIEKAPVGAYF